MVNGSPTSKAFELTIDGKTYQVQVLRPGVISVAPSSAILGVSVDRSGSIQILRVGPRFRPASLTQRVASRARSPTMSPT